VLDKPAPSVPFVVIESPGAVPVVQEVAIPKSTSKSTGPATLAAKASPSDMVVATAKMRFQPVAAVKQHVGVERQYASTMYLQQATDDELLASLAAAPEVFLEDKSVKSPAAAKVLLQDLANEIQAKNKEIDGYIRHLKDKRDDLGGLPFLLGKACQIDSAAAAALAAQSRLVRESLADVEGGGRRSSRQPGNTPARGTYFWGVYSGKQYYLGGAPRRTMIEPSDVERAAATSTPALRQILAAEESDVRVLLVDHIRISPARPATQALAQLALFDPDGAVRDAALMALQSRPGNHYEDVLLAGMRHPWLPIAQRAAKALIVLQRDDLGSRLVELLDQPDPSAPTVRQVGNTKVHEVQELVRINHHRNCLLCHPPIDVKAAAQGPRTASRTFPIGAVPIPGESLPPSTSRVYYERFEPNTILVRADVTYLRQDFSLLLPVANPGKWPEKQRFDFVVRSRQITAEQAAVRHKGPDMHRQFVLQALQALLRKDLGPETQPWRDEIARIEPSPGRFGKRPCVR
jgi:hypothetical protein